MLNITENSISHLVELSDFEAYKRLRESKVKRLTVFLVSMMLIGIFVLLFLPWTQNINAKGYVTTRSPQQRPQAIQSVIAGRLEAWYVQEGNFVNLGDTIVHISEVKSEYFDPELLTRTSEQLDAKSQSVTSYQQKISALKSQYTALEEGLELKLKQTVNKLNQARNKIKMDSIDLIAYKTNLDLAENQLSRTRELYDKGLKSLTELQDKEYKVQSSRAKYNVQQNKLINQRNETANAEIELLFIEREYRDKLAKSQSDQQSALSSRLESQAATSKLRNQLSNYSERQKLYYITAPQSGFITKAVKKGIGGTIKEGTDIATIMPSKYDLAVEIYLKPQDLPLLDFGNEAVFRFDGWPAIVISGWPEASTGIFRGEIVAIDQFISENGFYRAMISPIEDEKEWPEKLRVGTGVSAFLLLKDVPIWYEMWRQLNGFPADFYQRENDEKLEVKQKAPLKSVK